MARPRTLPHDAEQCLASTPPMREESISSLSVLAGCRRVRCFGRTAEVCCMPILKTVRPTQLLTIDEEVRRSDDIDDVVYELDMGPLYRPILTRELLSSSKQQN